MPIGKYGVCQLTKMPLFEDLYGKKCKNRTCWDHVGEKRPKSMEFIQQLEERGIVRFGIQGKLCPKYVGPFMILQKSGDIAYKLTFLPALLDVRDMFHASSLWKYVLNRGRARFYTFEIKAQLMRSNLFVTWK